MFFLYYDRDSNRNFNFISPSSSVLDLGHTIMSERAPVFAKGVIFDYNVEIRKKKQDKFEVRSILLNFRVTI